LNAILPQTLNKNGICISFLLWNISTIEWEVIAMEKNESKSWTKTVSGSTMEQNLLHSASDRHQSIDYHNDDKGFTRVDQNGKRHSYRDADNKKGHDHWVDGRKVDRK